MGDLGNFFKINFFFFNFLFHNSIDKFSRQIIVSNPKNQIESWIKHRCCAWVQKRVCCHQGLNSWPRAWCIVPMIRAECDTTQLFRRPKRSRQINCCQILWKVAQSPIKRPLWSHWHNPCLFYWMSSTFDETNGDWSNFYNNSPFVELQHRHNYYYYQCDQIGRFIGLWASFWSLW